MDDSFDVWEMKYLFERMIFEINTYVFETMENKK